MSIMGLVDKEVNIMKHFVRTLKRALGLIQDGYRQLETVRKVISNYIRFHGYSQVVMSWKR